VKGASLPDVVELIGYLASALIVLSLLMASVLKLRIINLVGAFVFTAYGVLIDSAPVVLTNGAIVMIDIYYLWKMWREQAAESYFEVVAWPTDGVYLPRFLTFHAEDIARSQPHFDGVHDDHVAFVVLRDAQPVGAVLVRDPGDGTAVVDLDYVIPAHRDFQAGAHVFGPHGPFATRGIRTVSAAAETPMHQRYLERLGFTPSGDGWTLAIP
jgi:hypothetical protein